MHWRSEPCLALWCLFAFAAAPVYADDTQVRSAPETALQVLTSRPWTGDLDGMIKRRMIRVLVVNSKTFVFVDKGTQRGITHDVFKACENDLDKKLKTENVRVHVVFVPVARDELLPALRNERGDIAAANLTVTPTPEQIKVVDFAAPIYKGVSEIVVTGPQSPEIKTIDDLAGQAVFVRKSSSYYESLVTLNARLEAEGVPEVKLTAAPDVLEHEDPLEMPNAGLIGLLVVDSHKAEFWAQIFPDIALHPDVALRTGGESARTIRKDRLKLRAALDAFGATHEKGTAFGNELAVGDVQQTEPNVHAGVKYIRLLLDRYYKDEPMDDTNHMLFALAS